MDLEDVLREEVLDGVLPPGVKINISALKKRYEVGLAPLREALSKLASTGLLISKPNVGFYVSQVSREELFDLYQVSAQLESIALAQAIEKGDSDWEEEIVSAIYHLEKVELGKSKPTYETWARANARFHDALVGSCSAIVKELRAMLHLKMSRYVRIAFGKAILDLGVFHQEHQKLAAAVLEKDLKLACLLMEKHIRNGQELLLKNFNKGVNHA